MNAVSQWRIGGLRTRKAKVMSSTLMGGSMVLDLGLKLFNQSLIAIIRTKSGLSAPLTERLSDTEN